MSNAVFLRFLLDFPHMPTNGDFLLRDLPGSGNRVDVLCRCLSACFGWASSTISSNEIEFRAVLSDELTLRFHRPEKAEDMGETDWARDIREGLKGTPPEYISIGDLDFEQNLQQLVNDLPTGVWLLHENSENSIKTWNPASQNSFILGDHKGFDSHSLKRVRECGIPDLSIGPLPYLGSHCIATVIAEAERRKNSV
jgi:tRNA (pseudouridine54-N1)-methyltransferase